MCNVSWIHQYLTPLSCSSWVCLPPKTSLPHLHTLFFIFVVLFICFVFGRSLASVSAACWNADWGCGFDLMQVTIPAGNSWVQWPCHILQAAFHSILCHLPALMFFSSPLWYLLSRGGVVVDIAVPFSHLFSALWQMWIAILPAAQAFGCFPGQSWQQY